MKISNIFLTLLTATFAFSYHIPKKLYKREEVLELDTITECEKAIKNECNLEINKNNLDDVCASFNSDKCQKLTKNISSLKACSSLGQDLVSSEQEIIKLQLNIVEFMCSRDENGKYCPYISFELEHSTLFGNENEVVSVESPNEPQLIEDKKKEDEENIKAVKETCKSKKCSDAFLKVIPFLDNSEKNYEIKYVKRHLNIKRDLQFKDGMTQKEKIIKITEYLKSDECDASVKNSSQNSSNNTSNTSSTQNSTSNTSTLQDSTSNANTIQYNNLLSIIGLLLLSILF
ncbi:hypothetical protein H8356DRAFT_1061817 [Neocallimastix lanati (nom. inval.)]|jgi:hypothetical protein|uniref:Uncharacterized protein n=1 Tax=Neocallimastix californiae TaxID=1754190 RepID=A0A1Y2D0K4_9FUNG|nr:hypothetical protein H8356DRAFT_1061817 [Neocallimastix sp. JGI-2020a]ORY52808.1 hypothetical protein LY90DRAFT_702679 [Neocallimastix californiae]|eukprot:ORY52808.1 hypothetical protein LY90DRAFT_702679 [Neocallimastix californiae]